MPRKANIVQILPPTMRLIVCLTITNNSNYATYPSSGHFLSPTFVIACVILNFRQQHFLIFLKSVNIICEDDVAMISALNCNTENT
jgi:hypothetical protein